MFEFTTRMVPVAVGAPFAAEGIVRLALISILPELQGAAQVNGVVDAPTNPDGELTIASVIAAAACAL